MTTICFNIMEITNDFLKKEKERYQNKQNKYQDELFELNKELIDDIKYSEKEQIAIMQFVFDEPPFKKQKKTIK